MVSPGQPTLSRCDVPSALRGRLVGVLGGHQGERGWHCRGGAQQAVGEGQGRLKQSRGLAGPSREPVHVQGWVRGIQWGGQGAGRPQRARMQDPGQRRGEGGQRGPGCGSPPSCLPRASPPGMLVTIWGCFGQPPASTGPSLPCCPGTVALEDQPSRPGQKTGVHRAGQKTGVHRAAEQAQLREVRWGAADCHLWHPKTGPSKGQRPRDLSEPRPPVGQLRVHLGGLPSPEPGEAWLPCRPHSNLFSLCSSWLEVGSQPMTCPMWPEANGPPFSSPCPWPPELLVPGPPLPAVSSRTPGAWVTLRQSALHCPTLSFRPMLILGPGCDDEIQMPEGLARR
ncbi:uncharacterized protein LOC102500481 isoform X1 [Tupaia chinensis]|uniref:uncharacterized protein LOC102500481 isoform X2 n=1 Tax=Tupaia chinensis TaxID=246437 RepID=UPI0003C91843|nr:uncharacterized protein LOC102500481 isoform X2 [Tupaia chinensis]XP_027630737.1 uncharacterized protein LOC102500481 isoform X1 [Tupaia chinensis]